MKKLIIIAILIAGWNYGNQALKTFQGNGSSATSVERTVSDQIDAVKGLIAGRLTTVGNSLATSPKATLEPRSIMSNATPTEIITQKNCSGMDCYTDTKS